MEPGAHDGAADLPADDAATDDAATVINTDHRAAHHQSADDERAELRADAATVAGAVPRTDDAAPNHPRAVARAVVYARTDGYLASDPRPDPNTNHRRVRLSLIHI